MRCSLVETTRSLLDDIDVFVLPSRLEDYALDPRAMMAAPCRRNGRRQRQKRRRRHDRPRFLQ
jgi:hypothetical protein